MIALLSADARSRHRPTINPFSIGRADLMGPVLNNHRQMIIGILKKNRIFGQLGEPPSSHTRSLKSHSGG
jgi:hypothetical protein